MILEKSAHPHEGIRALEAVWKRRIEQECAEAQRKGTREFVGTSFSFHLPPDAPSAPLRSPVKTAFLDSVYDSRHQMGSRSYARTGHVPWTAVHTSLAEHSRPLAPSTSSAHSAADGHRVRGLHA